jgi:hypothetical protein
MYDLTTIAQTRPANAQAPGPSMLAAIIGRIEEAIEAETIGIRTDIAYDIAASNARKSRHLYELSRAMKGVRPESLAADHHEALTRLRGKLAENEQVIQAHLTAVGEIAALLQETIRRTEADGTYSESQFGRAG